MAQEIKTAIPVMEAKDTPTAEFKHTQFIPVDSQTSVETTQVRSKVSGGIILNMFAMRQLIFGYATIQTPSNASRDLAAKLAIYMADRYDQDDVVVDGDGGLEVTRSEVQLMSEFLDKRLKHCTTMKQRNDPQFNANTFVAMRLLSCDLRDWLSISYA